LAAQCERDATKYSLRCINVEEDRDIFPDLEQATAPFSDLVTNIHGRFADNADHILHLIGDKPAIFFLDPFGVKGIPWRVIQKLVARRPATDLWIRFDDVMVQRLDGFYGKTSPDSSGKYQLLAETYGIEDKAHLHALLHAPSADDAAPAALHLYLQRLRDEIGKARGRHGYAGAYRIRSLSEEHKYYLVFAAAHEKAITLASATIHSVEQDYQRDLQEYKESRGRQLSLFDRDPTPEAVAVAKARDLSETIWTDCRGRRLSRLIIYAGQMPRWFGRISGSHLTQALKILIADKRATLVSGTVSQDDAVFQFKM
jgi:three-Cys-motif partner protein